MKSKPNQPTSVERSELPPEGQRAPEPAPQDEIPFHRQMEQLAPSAASGRSMVGPALNEGQSRIRGRIVFKSDEAPDPLGASTWARPSPSHTASLKCTIIEPDRLIIDLGNVTIVKDLAVKLKREVRSWGVGISHGHALTIVARAFGHDGYETLHSRIGLAKVSEPDSAVAPEEAARRYEQYMTVLSESGFSNVDAALLLDVVSAGPWWNFSKERVAGEIHGSRIRVARTVIEFLEVETAKKPFGVFKRSIHAQGIVVAEGRRHLFAKMFGHSTFNDLLRAAGLGNPSVPDFYLAPESLDGRVRGYLEVLSDAGIGEETALSILREGFGGWLAIEANEWQPLRQSRHVDRVACGRGSRWRPRRVTRTSASTS